MACMVCSKNLDRHLLQKATTRSKFCFLKGVAEMICKWTGRDLDLRNKIFLLQFCSVNDVPSNVRQAATAARRLFSSKVCFSFFQKSGGSFFHIFCFKALS